MMRTLPKLAADLNVDYHTLRRWIVTGRIQGVTPPVKGKWSYLTEEDVNKIASYVNCRVVTSKIGPMPGLMNTSTRHPKASS